MINTSGFFGAPRYCAQEGCGKPIPWWALILRPEGAYHARCFFRVSGLREIRTLPGRLKAITF